MYEFVHLHFLEFAITSVVIMMRIFTHTIHETHTTHETLCRFKTAFLQIAGCVNSQKIHLAKALSDGFEYRVIVFSSEEKAKQAYEKACPRNA